LYRSNNKQGARLGFAVAKKVLPLAVSRNRVRRICRESFRLKRELLPAVDIIILARRSADAANNAELFASLDRHWRALRDDKDLG
jgi:ribonuclease P protein component